MSTPTPTPKSHQQKHAIAREHFRAAEEALTLAHSPHVTADEATAEAAIADIHLRAASFARSWDENLGGQLRPEQASQ